MNQTEYDEIHREIEKLVDKLSEIAVDLTVRTHTRKLYYALLDYLDSVEATVKQQPNRKEPV